MAAVCCGLTFLMGPSMKTEIDCQISASVRQGRASVAAHFHALGTRMFPHFCMFRQRRQGRFQPSLEKKEYRVKGSKGRKEIRSGAIPPWRRWRRWRSPCLCGFQLAPMLARPWRTLAQVAANPLKRLRTARIAKPLNHQQPTGLTGRTERGSHR